jgi:hypothetical protein
VRTGGNVMTWTVAKADPTIVATEHRYTFLGWLGLILIVAVTAAHIVAAVKG